ncbi:helix-turn-helix domain-containing protein [Sinomicrobium pectinilyticum]|uniref:Helix-turn-helix domain-containing protein n=1 Tax=Sinomicrobium pectinilyticum TaxID=1084421 RepID=A0A3N0EG66_SINP1|nr:helix-turn-helix transcriptional regulator [Sinomicrobium pectinilyticum]RNL86679.1 helix-turn-helix domain-containing protein [Sinomicrobium pectinilyticum]
MDDIPVRYITDKKTRSHLWVRELVDVLNGGGLNSDLHRHDFYFLLFLKHGAGSHRIDFNEYKVSDRSLFILRPGQIHQLHLNPGSEGFLIQFGNNFYKPTDSYTQKALRFCGKKNFFKLSPDHYKSVLSYCANIHQESKHKDEGRIQSTLAYLDLLFIFLYRNFNEKKAANPNTTYYQEQLDMLLDVVETHLKEMKQVNDYASYLNQTPYQLNKITKTTLGKTFSEVIADSVLLEAKRYILGTSNQIKEIAYHLGYDDVSYFIRFFKTNTGKTPEEYRRSKLSTR